MTLLCNSVGNVSAQLIVLLIYEIPAFESTGAFRTALPEMYPVYHATGTGFRSRASTCSQVSVGISFLTG